MLPFSKIRHAIRIDKRRKSSNRIILLILLDLIIISKLIKYYAQLGNIIQNVNEFQTKKTKGDVHARLSTNYFRLGKQRWKGSFT